MMVRMNPGHRLLPAKPRLRHNTERRFAGLLPLGPCTISRGVGPLPKQKGKLFVTPNLPWILGLATRMAQLDCHSTCDTSPKSCAPGYLFCHRSRGSRVESRKGLCRKNVCDNLHRVWRQESTRHAALLALPHEQGSGGHAVAAVAQHGHSAS
jgi:hypothetical protein